MESKGCSETVDVTKLRPPSFDDARTSWASTSLAMMTPAMPLATVTHGPGAPLVPSPMP